MVVKHALDDLQLTLRKMEPLRNLLPSLFVEETSTNESVMTMKPRIQSSSLPPDRVDRSRELQMLCRTAVPIASAAIGRWERW